VGSLLWNLNRLRDSSVQLARLTALVTFENDVLYRRWSSQQGGVYVRVSEGTPPNPYLEVPDRDLTTTSGASLTLVNPAYMARQVNALANEASGSRGHLTSLNPIRPANAPDPWEADALRSFEHGVSEVSSLELMTNGEHFRFMRPFVTERSCLACHATQGYREGDIRGGISVSIPMAPLRAVENPMAEQLALAHAGLWMIGLAGIGIFRRSLGKEILAREVTRADLQSEVIERRQAEERLREVNDRYELVLAGAQAAIWDWDVRQHKVLFSSQWKAIRGLAKEEVSDAEEEWSRHIHPEDAPRVTAAVQAHFAGQTPCFAEEYRVRHKDGSWKWIADRGLARRDAEGRVLRMAGSETDITEHKQAEEAIAKHREELQVILDSSPALIFYKDRENRFLRVNRAFSEIMELPKEQLEGRSIFDLYPREQANAYWRDDQEVIESRNPKHGIVEPMQTLRGERWFQTEKIPCCDAQGNVIGVIGFALDITARKQTEERFRQAAADLQTANASLHDSRRAALNLMDDALAARQQAEEANAELRCEVEERRQAEAALRISEARFRLLSDIANRLLATQDPQKLINELCRDVMKFLDCQVFLNFLAVEQPGIQGARLHLNAYAGITDDDAHRVEWLDYGVAVCGCVARDGLRIVVDDIQHQADPRTALVKTFGVQAYCCHPLLAQERVIGTLAFGSVTRPQFTAEEVELMRTVADQVAVAMQRLITLKALEAARSEAVSEKNRLAAVMETLPVGVSFLDALGGVVQTNPSFDKIWGAPRPTASCVSDYAAFKAWWADTGKIIQPEEWASARAVQHNEIVVDQELQIQRFDGTRRYVLNSAAPIRDGTGRVIGCAVAIQDITARKQAETALRQSREDLNDAQAVAHIGSWRLDLESHQLLWSEETYRIFAIPQGTPLTDRTFFDSVHPEDREYVFQQWQAALQGEPYDIELRIYAGDKVKWVHEQAAMEIVSEGVAHSFFGTVQDITEWKRVEASLAQARADLEQRVLERTAELQQAVQLVQAERQRFQDVLDRLPAYLVLLSPDYHVRFANRFFESRFGKSDGRRCYEYLFARTEPCENCESYKVLQTKAPYDWEWTGPDGRIYEIHDSPFTDVDGSLLVLEVGVDVTERKAAERERQKLRDELARFSRITTAGQLAASLAHELNQPLGAITCNIQAIEQLLATGTLDNPEVLEALKDIAADSQRAGAVIHQLRSLYQKTGQRRTVIQLNHLLQKTTDLLHSEFVIKDVAMRFELDKELPVIKGNEVELQQVVLNLLTNCLEALAARDPGTRSVLIRTTCTESNKVLVSFRDSGTGLVQEQMRRIFEPFYTTKATGTGMGLAICQSIIEAHDGQLWAKINAEGGATFCFTLPVVPNAPS
jgi:PAS domain S-box-containing protein